MKVIKIIALYILMFIFVALIVTNNLILMITGLVGIIITVYKNKEIFNYIDERL